MMAGQNLVDIEFICASGQAAPIRSAALFSIMVQYRQGGCDGSIDRDGIQLVVFDECVG